MPDFCSAYGCSNKRRMQTRTRGITFHRFPKDSEVRKRWELAVRRDGFVATHRSMLCSEHFKPEDFDRTGQIVRLRLDVIPSVFNFPTSLQKREGKRRTTHNAKKAVESQLMESTQLSYKAEPQINREGKRRTTHTAKKAVESQLMESTQLSYKAEPQMNDHNYALPTSPTALKAKLSEALARVESLEREMRNAKIRELRAKKNMHSVLEDLREKNLILKNL